MGGVGRHGRHLIGVASSLRKHSPSLLCAAVEPAGCEPRANRAITKPLHLLQGIGYGQVPPQWDASLMSLSVAVTDDDADQWRRTLAVCEGLDVGFSAAANVSAAARVLSSGALPPDAVVATVLCDTGLKY